MSDATTFTLGKAERTLTPEEFVKRCRAAFEDARIGKLPRVTCPDCRDRNCSTHAKARCNECRNNMTTAHMHIDYVGHADVTARLLELDPTWSWEPMGFDALGLPAVVERKGQAVLWIRLTVRGVTRVGVGTCETGGRKDEIDKELIGDAIRNAAMRFGIGLDLWMKHDLDSSPRGDDTGSAQEPATRSQSQRKGRPAKKAASTRKRQGSAQNGSAGVSEDVAERREQVTWTMGKLSGKPAAEAKKALDAAGLWPVVSLADDQLDAALEILAPIYEKAQA